MDDRACRLVDEVDHLAPGRGQWRAGDHDLALVLVGIALRLSGYDTRSHPTGPILVISIVVAALVAVGATFGGSLVFEHGFNVETAGDSPAWHVSETDVMPGDPDPVEDEMSPAERLADSEVAVTNRTPDPLDATNT